MIRTKHFEFEGNLLDVKYKISIFNQYFLTFNFLIQTFLTQILAYIYVIVDLII